MSILLFGEYDILYCIGNDTICDNYTICDK